jgi:hypothetical protein
VDIEELWDVDEDAAALGKDLWLLANRGCGYSRKNHKLRTECIDKNEMHS